MTGIYMIDTTDKRPSTTCSSSSASSASSSPLMPPIRPPTPPSVSSSLFHPAYSLFESHSVKSHLPWDWLPSGTLRHPTYYSDNSEDTTRHPVEQASQYTPDPASFYVKRCSSCLRQDRVIIQVCEHYSLCQLCLQTSQGVNAFRQCLACQARPSSPLVPPSPPLLTRPLSETPIGFKLHSPTQPTRSKVIMCQKSGSTPPFPCAKLSNIPWDVSQNDVRIFFSHCNIPSQSSYAQAIHIMMDRTTGKTLSDAFVEFATYADLRRAIDTRNGRPLKGRVVTITEFSQQDLLSTVFPRWRGRFCGTSAIPPTSDVVKSMSSAVGGGGSTCPPFITREEINSLLVICKNYKLHFSRKCAERPFENIISVLVKYPWHQAHLISTIHRDHVYEMLKLSIETLKVHLSKDYVQIDPTLLERLVRAGILCPAFTERQKSTLLQLTRMECPADIVQYLIPQPNTTLPPHLTMNISDHGVQSPKAGAEQIPNNTKVSHHGPTKEEYNYIFHNGQEIAEVQQHNVDSDDDSDSLTLKHISTLIHDIQQSLNTTDKGLIHDRQASPVPSAASAETNLSEHAIPHWPHYMTRWSPSLPTFDGPFPQYDVPKNHGTMLHA